MTSRTHIFSCTLAILAVCAVALRGQTRTQGAQTGQKSLPTLSAQEIFRRVSPSVMVVESLDGKGKVIALGSGVVIAPNRVITNRHVIEDGVSFRVEHDGKKWPAKLVRVDPDHDLAELSAEGLDAPAVTILDSSKLAVGETVYGIGAPEGLELTISEGLISGLRDFDKGRVIQTSAAISPGSSGGGLFDAQGRLVGITTFYLKEGQSLNFALPAEWTLALNRQPPKATSLAGQSRPEFRALIWCEFGFMAFRGGKYAIAADAYKQAIRLKPDYEVAWFGLGGAYHDLGEHDKAASAYREAIRLKPNDETAWFELGIAYGSLNEDEKAVSTYQEALRLNVDDEDAWFELGVEYESLGQYGKAANAEEEAIRLKPDHELSWVGLGFAYENLNEHDRAVNAFQESLRLKPDDESAWQALGVAYGRLGQYDKEVSAEQEAIQLKPDDEAAWFDLGAAHDHLAQYGKEVEALQQATRLKPGDAVAWYFLGVAYKASGQQSEMIKVYGRLKALDPKLAEKLFRECVLP